MLFEIKTQKWQNKPHLSPREDFNSKEERYYGYCHDFGMYFTTEVKNNFTIAGPTFFFNKDRLVYAIRASDHDIIAEQTIAPTFDRVED